MNNLRNRVQLIGNLGRDVEIKALDNGRAIARASIATREVYRNEAGEKTVEVQWHTLVAWGKLAELMHAICKKGKEVAVQGKLTRRIYTDKDGVSRQTSEVVVNEFMLMN
jgi:single-strand DNA-binding protein